MTLVTYKGDSDVRIIDASSFPDILDDFQYRWSPEDTLDIRDDVAQHLVEFAPNDFALFEDPKNRDHRSRKQLLAEADKLQIEGRSRMSKEELRDAVNSRRAEIEESEENSTSESGE